VLGKPRSLVTENCSSIWFLQRTSDKWFWYAEIDLLGCNSFRPPPLLTRLPRSLSRLPGLLANRMLLEYRWRLQCIGRITQAANETLANEKVVFVPYQTTV
ncbi:hypothetical protein STEG23_027889, partial [Scotinomys teguina]